MKIFKILLFFVALLSTQLGHAQAVLENQEDSEPQLQKKHEVKLNGLMLLVGAFEGFYEYNLNEDSSIGASVFVSFSDDLNDLKYFSPYYRIFFGKKYAAGFFFEGFGMVNNYEYNNELIEISTGNVVFSEKQKTTDFALGLGLGGKWVTSRNIIFEVNGGVGRNLFNSEDVDGGDFVGKIGFNIGYRF